MEDDKTLIEHILKTRDFSKFSQIYDKYRKKVFYKCKLMVGSEEIADDLTQDIFVKVMEKLEFFRGESQFSTWLYSITYNYCIEYLRKTKRIRFEMIEPDLELPEEVEEEHLLEIMNARESKLAILMEMLKPEDKAILQMKYLEGLKISMIGPLLNLQGESAVKMRLSRAKKRLYALYQNFFEEEG